ncbi:MAG: quinone oxidoreductase [Caulobacteraceae bacterium]|nr:quinone oxidoreductase [Caulobacteraceae bacterium]
MRAVQIARTGGPDMLELSDIPTPEPGPGQIRVRHQAIGLNFVDAYFRSGLYPLKLPATLGQEAAGVVDAVGDGDVGFKVGDRVGYAGQFGAYAEYNVIPAARAIRLPDGVSAELAAASLLKGMTAEFLLRRCYPVKTGDAILVHAAAGGVGSVLTQWGKALGAVVIGAVGDQEKAVLAQRQGCDHVILSRREDVAARVREITGGEGVPVVYDGVGAATFEASLASLRRRGMLISFGNASGPAPAIEPARLQRGGSLFLTRPTMGDYLATPQELAESAAALFHVMLSGAVTVPIGARFALADVRKAHEAMEGRQTTGSTLLLP